MLLAPEVNEECLIWGKVRPHPAVQRAPFVGDVRRGVRGSE